MFRADNQAQPAARAPFSCDRPRKTKSRSTSRSQGFQMPSRPVLRIAEKPGTKKRRNERAGVNREIEPAKHFRKQMFVRIAKLIANVRRYAWFDPACTQTNKRQSYYEHRPLPNGDSP